MMLYRAYKVTMNGYYVDKIDIVIKENLTFESERVKSLNVNYYERTDTTLIEFTTMRPQ